MLRRRHRGEAAHPSYELSEWTPRGVPPRAQHAPWTRRFARRFARTKNRIDATVRVAFARHGRWISLHQTRTLLLCNLVIASLFYPAVVMCLLMTSGSTGAIPDPECAERHVVHGSPSCVSGAHAPRSIWGVLRSSLADLAGTSPSFRRDDEAYPVHDLHLIWDETPSLEVVEHPELPPETPRVHVAQVVITADSVRAGGGSPYGVIQPHTLLAAHRLQTALSASLRSCVRDATTGSCLVLSPVNYWSGAHAIASDAHPAKSITGNPIRGVISPPVGPSASNASMPLLYSTTLAGRWPYLPLFSRAEFLVLTYFLTDMDGWADAVREASRLAAASTASVSTPPVAPGSTYLRFVPQSSTLRPTLDAGVVAAGYLLLLVYIFRGLVQMRRLHSRFGIAFTGTAQLIIDMIMSLSLCALLGVQLNAVPWAILPFVIVVVGSESMLYMIRTITNTPLSLTVHSRIAYGLSQVAQPITLTVLSDLVILALACSVVRVPSVMQFCAFVMCTLLVDYFMQMTFFVTVLSIDMQRLELAEVLVQGQPTTIEKHHSLPGDAVPQQCHRPRGAGATVMHGIAVLWRTRSARSMSFVLVMAGLVVCCQYYGRDFGKLQRGVSTAADAYTHFWSSINPRGTPLAELVTEPWTLVSFSDLGTRASDAAAVPGPWLELLFFYRRAATLLLIVLLVACPIAASMVVLSLILRYLRRDADRLEDSGAPDIDALVGTPERPSLILHVTAHTSALHGATVAHACARDGVIASTDTVGVVRIADGSAARAVSLSAARQSEGLAADASRITAVNVRRDVIALGHASGRFSVYSHAWSALIDNRGSAPVCHVEFWNDVLLTLFADGALLATHVAPRPDTGGVTWGGGGSDAQQPQHTLVRALEGAWRYVPLDVPSSDEACICAASASRVRVYCIKDAGRATIACDAPVTGVHSAALVALPERRDTLEAPDIPGDTQPLLPEQGPPPRIRSPRRGGSGTHCPDQLLVVGGTGIVHAIDTGAANAVTSLALDGAGPVRRVQVLESSASLCVLAAHSADRIWLIGLRTDPATLSLLASIDSTRGAADAIPWTYGESAYLCGIRRAANTGGARWEAWRMRMPRFSLTMSPVDSPPLECAQLDLEALVRDGARATERLPAMQLPLLASRINCMIRGNSERPTWLVPLGSVLVTLEASQGP